MPHLIKTDTTLFLGSFILFIFHQIFFVRLYNSLCSTYMITFFRLFCEIYLDLYIIFVVFAYIFIYTYFVNLQESVLSFAW